MGRGKEDPLDGEGPMNIFGDAKTGVETFLGWSQLSELAERDREPCWVIDGVLPLGGLTFLFGLPGAMKTFLAIDVALHVAVGLEWCGKAVRRLRVFFIEAERGQGFASRVLAWLHAFGVDEMPENTAILTEDVQLLDAADMARLRRDIDSIRTKDERYLLIIDTMSRCAAGVEENSSSDMGRVVAAMDELRGDGATVLALHHTDKKGKAERGSSVLSSHADTMLRVTASKDGVATVTVEKQRDSKTGDIYRLKRRDVMLPGGETSCVLDPYDGQAGDGKQSKAIGRDQRALRALAAAGAQGLGYEQWQTASTLKGGTFTRALKALIASGQAVKGADGRYRVASIVSIPGGSSVQPDQLPPPLSPL